MSQNQCQHDGCDRMGQPRWVVDNSQNCKWTYYLCDECYKILPDREKIVLARTKGSSTA